MKWSDLKGSIGKFAPWIATALGGPAAGMGVKALCGAIGLDETTAKVEDVEALFRAGTLTGDQLAAMKKADLDFQLQMKTLDITSIEKLEELAVDDRKSARDREVQTKDWTPRVLSSAITLGFFGILLFMMLRSVPQESRDILNIMLGSLGTAWISVVTYYFGSSSGSSKKTEMIHNSTPIDKG